MCGRYSLTVKKEKLKQEFGLQEEHLKSFSPRYNIAPSQPVSVLISQEGKPKLELCNWGLIPSWAKDPAIGNRMINARKETVTEKPSFRGPFKNKRCLVLADGFYEWKKEGPRKIPFYIRLKSNRPFGFAGLYSDWQSKEGRKVSSCAIITTVPNELVRPIHERMPVILLPGKREEWLDPKNNNLEQLLQMLEPYPANEMEAYPVSKLVNDPKNDSPDCILKARD